MCNRNGLGYTGVTKDVPTTSKIVFVKPAATTPNHPGSDKIVKPGLSQVKRFVPTCYHCNMPGHIHPKCYKYIKILRTKKIEKHFYKQRTTPKIRIELDNKSPNRLWIKRSDLFCNVVYTFFKTTTTDS